MKPWLKALGAALLLTASPALNQSLTYVYGWDTSSGAKCLLGSASTCTAAPNASGGSGAGAVTAAANAFALGSIIDLGTGSSPGANTVNGRLVALIAAVGSPLQAGGTVTANAGTNLNTSLLATDAHLTALTTAMGSPFQAGGSIGNTSFGISGTLPAFATTPTFNIGTAPTLTISNSSFASTIADGADVTLGAKADPAWTSGAGSSIAILKTIANAVAGSIPAGSNVIGHVLVDSAPTTAVTGTFWQATQPVSIASMPSTPVTGTFWQTTQPISAASLPLPSGAMQQTGGSVGLIPVSSTGSTSAVTVGMSSAQALASGTRKYLSLDNESTTATIACNFGGSAAINTAGSYTLPPGTTRTWIAANGFVPSDAVNCIASAASTPMTLASN